MKKQFKFDVSARFMYRILFLLLLLLLVIPSKHHVLAQEDPDACSDGNLPDRSVNRDCDALTDDIDACPDETGFGPDGCPVRQVQDSDGDGQPDDIDSCPNEPASTLNGCPIPTVVQPTQPPPPTARPAATAAPVVTDSDGDGIADNADSCPRTFGQQANGCPIPTAVPDGDGDGVADTTDACPNVAGTGDGCMYRSMTHYALAVNPAGEATDGETTGTVTVMMQGDDGRLYLSSGADSWSAWIPLADKEGSDPALAWTNDGQLHAFVVDQNRDLWHTVVGEEAAEWVSMQAIVTSSPTATAYGESGLAIFATGDSGELWYRVWDGSAWAAWESLGGIWTSAPAAISLDENSLDVFIRGEDDALWHRQQRDGAWSEWESLEGTLTSAPTAIAVGTGDDDTPDTIHVFAAGEESILVRKVWDSGTWLNWEEVGGMVLAAPAVAVSGEDLHVFARGTDDKLWYLASNGESWSNWTTWDGVLFGDPVAYALADGRVGMIVQGDAGQMWSRAQLNGLGNWTSLDTRVRATSTSN